MTNSPKFTMEFEIDDIPWMFHALTIASSTALMSENGDKKVKKRIRSFIDQIQAFYPTLANWNIKEYAWFYAMAAIREAKESWSIFQYVQYNTKWEGGVAIKTIATDIWDQESIYIMVDNDRLFAITDSSPYNPDRIKTLTEIIQQIVPNSVKLQEMSDEDVRKYGCRRAKY